jgi:hypothetical protein
LRDPPCLAPRPRPRPREGPLLLVVEGANDESFLKTLSGILSAADPALPNLLELAASGDIVFIPFGGGSPLSWGTRLASLGCREFHLYDRELPPESAFRQIAAARVNARPGCQAFVTSSRSLENSLHPQAIRDASGGECTVEFGPDDCVATLVARDLHRRRSPRDWNDLSRFEQTRLVQKAKRWLNTVAVRHMTPELLQASDPRGDIARWLQTIRSMLPASRCASYTC